MNKLQKIKSWILNHKKTTTVLALTIVLPYLFTPSQTTSNNNKEQTVVEKKEVTMIFDVPSYFGKSIEEITKILGTPTKDEEPTKEQLKTLQVETWEKVYIKDGYNLMVEFDLKTRKVLSFFLDRNGELTEDNKQELAKVANVDLSNKSYNAKMVPVMNTTSKFTGLLIKDKQVVIDEWNRLVDIGKEGKIIYKDDKNNLAYDIYVDYGWYLIKVDMKKNIVSRMSKLKEEITGYHNIKFKDSNSGEIVAEVTAFSGSTEIYK